MGKEAAFQKAALPFFGQTSKAVPLLFFELEPQGSNRQIKASDVLYRWEVSQ